MPDRNKPDQVSKKKPAEKKLSLSSNTPKSKNPVKSVAMVNQGTLAVNLQRRPGAAQLLLSLEEAVAIGKVATNALLQEN